jgi:hypothetical protein
MKIEPFDPDKMDRDFGRFRIGVLAEAVPHGWASFKRLSGIPSELVKHFETSKGYGNPYEWRASFQAVEKKHWRAVEQLHHGIWVSYVDLESGSPTPTAS